MPKNSLSDQESLETPEKLNEPNEEKKKKKKKKEKRSHDESENNESVSKKAKSTSDDLWWDSEGVEPLANISDSAGNSIRKDSDITHFLKTEVFGNENVHTENHICSKDEITAKVSEIHSTTNFSVFIKPELQLIFIKRFFRANNENSMF